MDKCHLAHKHRMAPQNKLRLWLNGISHLHGPVCVVPSEGAKLTQRLKCKEKRTKRRRRLQLSSPNSCLGHPDAEKQNKKITVQLRSKMSCGPDKKRGSSRAPNGDAPMNTMEGARSSATLNNSRTSLGPSPRYFWMSSDPTTRRKVADVLLATALANNVLPVPGSPYKITPCSTRTPYTRSPQQYTTTMCKIYPCSKRAPRTISAYTPQNHPVQDHTPVRTETQ